MWKRMFTSHKNELLKNIIAAKEDLTRVCRGQITCNVEEVKKRI
jgi:hypothetical protein